jgi:uncharacterized protein with von Willebrand factor type A (vWA) domain
VIAHRIAQLGRALRDAEVGVCLTDEIDAARALSLVDLADVDEVARALRIALKIPRASWDLFDRYFRAIWAGGEPLRPVSAPVAATRGGAGRGGRFPRWDAERASLAEEEVEGNSEGEVPGFSPRASNRGGKRPQCSPTEVAALERVVAGWAKRLATLKSRRLVPSSARGFVDPRRSLRRAVRTSGEVLHLARRRRARDIPRLAFVCDTSGSMSPHARFLLAFALALKRVAPRTEVFAFNTTLTRLTSWIAPAKIALTLDRLATGVPDWGGGTRIGESLLAFVERAGAFDGRTVVVILSDGLDRGDTDRLREAMRRIRARARKIVWLNPLLQDPRYRPEAQGMEAALPFVDHFAAAYDAASLERLLPELRA